MLRYEVASFRKCRVLRGAGRCVQTHASNSSCCASLLRTLAALEHSLVAVRAERRLEPATAWPAWRALLKGGGSGGGGSGKLRLQ